MSTGEFNYLCPSDLIVELGTEHARHTDEVVAVLAQVVLITSLFFNGEVHAEKNHS